jgi:hypothetical protein
MEDAKLPEWVETLIAAEKEKAYQLGYNKGYSWAWEKAIAALERAKYN